MIWLRDTAKLTNWLPLFAPSPNQNQTCATTYIQTQTHN